MRRYGDARQGQGEMSKDRERRMRGGVQMSKYSRPPKPPECPRCGFSGPFDGQHCRFCGYGNERAAETRCPMCKVFFVWDGSQCRFCGWRKPMGRV